MADNKINKTSEIKNMQVGDKFYALGVVSKSSMKKDKNGRPYWDLTLMDGDGTLDGKVWGNGLWYSCEDGGKDTIGDPLADSRTRSIDGKTLGLQGQIGEYKGQPQYTFNSVYYVNQDKYPPHSFVRRSPIPHDELEKSLHDMCGICGEPLSGFLDFVLYKKGYWDKYKDWPAAVTHHHAYVGGLLEHSLAAARVALEAAKSYRALGMKIDIDLVIAGALLHDLGKLDSYELNPAPAATAMGTVIDHVALGYMKISELGKEYGLDEKLLLSLSHIILSHHGTREFGSPILPATPEALIVAAADDLDFKLFCWNEAIAGLDDDKDVSDFHFAMQRRFWKG